MLVLYVGVGPWCWCWSSVLVLALGVGPWCCVGPWCWCWSLVLVLVLGVMLVLGVGVPLPFSVVDGMWNSTESRHEKTYLRGLRTG